MPPTWAVVATVDEPAPLVAAFVTHHLNEGAQAVHVFLDRPDPETEQVLRPIKGCLLTICDAAHWQGRGGGRRPRRHPMRQIANANIAYADCTADWLVHCDADEFIRDGRAMAQELAEAPPDCLHLRLRVAERAVLAGAGQQELFDGVFRMPRRAEPWMLEPIYGASLAFLSSGLTGHVSGKAVMRCQKGLRLSIHEPEGRIPARPLKSTRLLHFDGPTALALQIKLLLRAFEPPRPGKSRHPSGRQAQIAQIREYVPDPQLRARFVAGLRSLTPEQAEMLDLFGLIDTKPFQPNLAGLPLDLSVEGFDARLRRRNAGFLAEHGIEI